jgi:phosphate-selective porin
MPIPTPLPRIPLAALLLCAAASLAPAAAQRADSVAGAAPAARDTAPAPPRAAPRLAVESAVGRITVSGLLQGWFTSGDASFDDSFRMRRAEIRLTGEVSPSVRWTIMVDPSKSLSLVAAEGGGQSVNQASRMLQDASISLSLSPAWRVDVGQQKVPLSLEGLQSSAALETVERALFLSDRGRGGNYGDIRDIGVVVRGTAWRALDLHVGAFNGSGETQNDVDRNDAKALAGRAVLRVPGVPGLQVGAFGAWGAGEADDRPRRDRAGAELLFRRGAWTLKSEGVAGADGDLDRRGFYALVGYRPAPRLEAVVRFDTWDPDLDADDAAASAAERDYLAGLTYTLAGSPVRIQANYVRKHFADEVAPTRNLLMLNLQTAW